MRAIILILLGLLCTTSLVGADEQFSTLKVGADIYSNVTVTSFSATDIYFTHADGLGNAKLKDLDPVLQKHFHYNEARAKAVEQDQGSAGNPPDLSNPKAALDDAMARVRFIVNQPVTALPVTSDKTVALYEPDWFHPGAIRPDFNTVDVRASQECKYGANQYCASAASPGVCYYGSELEFNAMTKFFYTDRSVPKKKLTDAEMVEINRLYRIIGTCEQKLSEPPGLGRFPHSIPAFLSAHMTILASAAAGLFFVLMAILNLRKGRSPA